MKISQPRAAWTASGVRARPRIADFFETEIKARRPLANGVNGVGKGPPIANGVNGAGKGSTMTDFEIGGESTPITNGVNGGGEGLPIANHEIRERARSKPRQ